MGIVNSIGNFIGNSSSRYWTPQSSVVENAQPTKVVMTGTASNTNAVAGDFTIAGFTVSSLARDATNKILTLTLSTAATCFDNLVVVYKGRSYNVTNNVVWTEASWAAQLPTKQAEYIALGWGTMPSYSALSFTDVYANYINGDPDIFQPTDLDVGQWLDAYVAAGMKYAVLNAKNHDGFCMWPTQAAVPGYSPYSIAQSSWYVDAAHSDIVKLFTDGCRARGLKPILYMAINDFTYDARVGVDHTNLSSSQRDAYIVWDKIFIHELLTNYGDITALWIDGWGWALPYNPVTGIPFATIRDYVGSLQKNCLLISNDHLSPSDSEIKTYESPSETEIPAANAIPAEFFQTPRVDGKNCYYDALSETSGDYISAATIHAKLIQCVLRGGNYLLDTLPNRTGKLATAQVALLTAVGNLQKSTISSGVVTNADKNKIVLTTSALLDVSITPATTAFTPSGGKTVTNVLIGKQTITLTVNSNYSAGDTITVSYIKPGTNPITSMFGARTMDSFSNQAVTNSIATFSDSFTDTDDVTLQNHGTGWTAPSGMKISSNKLVCVGANAVMIGYRELSKTDNDISVNFTLPNANVYFGGIVLRYQDDSHYWCAVIEKYDSVDPLLSIYINNGGFVRPQSEAITLEQVTDVLRFRVVGNVFTATWKTHTLTNTDSTFNDKTKVGIIGFGDTPAKTPIVDDMTVI